MPRVVQIPVARDDPAFALHPGEQLRAGIRRLDVERGGRDAVLDRPVHRPSKHIFIVVVHAEDEAAVDHDAQFVQAVRHGGIVAAQVLALVRPRQIGRRQGLEADEEASQAGGGGALDQIALKNGIHCGGAR